MKPGTPSFTSTRLLDQLRERMPYLHYSLQTEKACLYWVRFLPARYAAHSLSTTHKRTGIPRSAMRCLACPTVYSP